MTGPDMYGSNNSHQNQENRTAQLLRRALHDKAETIHTGEHALDEIQARIDGVIVTDATVTQLHQPRPLVRYLSMAAVGLVAIGGLAYFTQTRTGEIEIAVPPTSATVVEETPTTSTPEPVVETTTVPTQATTTVENVASIAKPTGPVASTKAKAATKFLSLVGITEQVEFIEDGNVLSVRSPRGDADVVSLTLTQISDGWAVTGASSEGITANVDSYDPEASSAITVSGVGRGFESQVDLKLVSAFDGSLLGKTFADAGQPDPIPYAAEIETVGSEAAWVVVISDGAGDEGVLQEFAATPVAFVGKPDPRTYGVFRIPVNDQDDGLNLRSSPGTDGNTVLATLPAGTSGISRTASMPVLVGDSVWREVIGPDNQKGWAHTNFLTPLDPVVSDEELLYIGNQFANATQQDSHWGFPLLPWSERTQISFAWIGDLDNKDFRFDADTMKAGGVWGPDSFRNWAVPAETFGQDEINSTHRDFLSLPQGAELDVRVGDGTYAYEFEKSMIDRFLPNLRSVVVSNMNSDTSWSEVHIFVEPTSEGARIVAIAVSHMIP